MQQKLRIKKLCVSENFLKLWKNLETFAIDYYSL